MADKGPIPCQGIGQGNGAGPTFWGVVSTPAFNSMRERGYGVFLKTPITGSEFFFVGYAFIDDTDLCITDPPDKQRPTSLIPRIQESLNWWEATCRTTGGAIVQEKSHWYLIDFIWEKGKWKYITPDPADPPLIVRNP